LAQLNEYTVVDSVYAISSPIKCEITYTARSERPKNIYTIAFYHRMFFLNFFTCHIHPTAGYAYIACHDGVLNF